VKLGAAEVKSVDDFAGLTPDDLRGWFETKDGERTRQPGLLDEYKLTSEEANELIMRARMEVGWITEDDYKAAIGADQAQEPGAEPANE
jgi:N utilization substance protein A